MAFLQPPPGEEGFSSSHAGGEIQLQDLFLDTLAEQSVFCICFLMILLIHSQVSGKTIGHDETE